MRCPVEQSVMPGGDTDEEDIAAAREEVISTMADVAKLFGAKRSHGRLFGILYFAGEALSMDDLAAESGYAKSTVSTAMATLTDLGLVTRQSQPGEGKRVFFEPEDDLWTVFETLLGDRIGAELDGTTRSLRAAKIVYEEVDTEQARRDREQVEQLLAACEQADLLIDIVTSDMDLSALAEDVRDGGD